MQVGMRPAFSSLLSVQAGATKRCTNYSAPALWNSGWIYQWGILSHHWSSQPFHTIRKHEAECKVTSWPSRVAWHVVPCVVSFHTTVQWKQATDHCFQEGQRSTSEPGNSFYIWPNVQNVWKRPKYGLMRLSYPQPPVKSGVCWYCRFLPTVLVHLHSFWARTNPFNRSLS